MGDGFSQLVGAVLILVGGHTLGLYRIPFLMRDMRFQKQELNKLTVVSSFLFGVLFGAGWSPCIGPILAGILALASTSGHMASAVVLMIAFSTGLAIPFMGSAVLVTEMKQWARKNARYTRYAEKTMGLLILLIGVLLFFVSIHDMSQWATEHLPWASALFEIESAMVETNEQF
jgi:cytochrome c-type biogenesis protein